MLRHASKNATIGHRNTHLEEQGSSNLLMIQEQNAGFLSTSQCNLKKSSRNNAVTWALAGAVTKAPQAYLRSNTSSKKELGTGRALPTFMYIQKDIHIYMCIYMHIYVCMYIHMMTALQLGIYTRAPDVLETLICI